VPNPTNDLAKKCTRLRRAGTIAFLGHSGRNAVRFQGRVSKHKTLKPGRYQAKITVSDPTDPVPSTRTLRFTIVQG
jgi:hypothetical protein